MLRAERWMTGYGQPDPFVYRAIQPALQLASLFITEDCTLPWFTHLVYGRRKYETNHTTGEKRVYLEPTKLEHARASLQEVKADMAELSRILTFQFVPSSYRKSREWGTSYGITCSHTHPPWHHKFSLHDFPPIPSKYGTGHYANRSIPAILLQPDFATVFSPPRWLQLTPCQRYRIMFLFAITLVHEIAHAYHQWFFRRFDVGRDGKWVYDKKKNEEPMWSAYDERGNELGYAWEAVTVGKIVDPLEADTVGVPCLIASETHAWRTSSKIDEEFRKEARRKRLEKLVDTRGVRFTRIPGGKYGDERSWKPATWLRANQWFCEDGVAADHNVISVVHVIPMRWIISWFMEDEWEEKRRRFRCTGKYEPKRLGPTFVIVYER
ncbi:hypothetical protein BCR34DRAFT_519477, partial [Clohesyomyces aquaticus]